MDRFRELNRDWATEGLAIAGEVVVDPGVGIDWQFGNGGTGGKFSRWSFGAGGLKT